MQSINKTTDVSVIILGSGTCVPSLSRSSCSVLMQTGSNKLLFDAGPGTMGRLLEAGVTIFDITHIFFSHLHPDHTGELVPFLFANKYPDGTRRKRPLTICGGTGFLAFYNQLKMIYNQWIDGAGKLTISEFSHTGSDSYQFDGFTINTVPVQHRDESIAFKVTALNGTTMVYSGDTDYSENLIGLAENTDLFICESALPDHLKADGHLTPSLAGQMATLANVKKLVLTHFYPECENVDIEKQCRKTYAGPLVLAKDLMTINLDT